MEKKGILLINLGTPEHSDKRSVRKYLNIFLSDARVIDLPFLVRWLLVNVIIAPFRAKKSSRAYQKIWQDNGSPLRVLSLELATELRKELKDTYHVALGMRYGNPSIESALAALADCTTLCVVPLYPQYASSTTGSAIEKVFSLLSKKWNIPKLFILNDFYNDPGFITAYADIIQNTLQNKIVDCLLFSYHSLPERHLTQSLCQATCDRLHPCPAIDAKNHYCYRAQSFATSRTLATSLKLTDDQYQVTFQSRLGRVPWIKPYTDKTLITLAKQGKKNIAIVCPSFVTDCLETLEEINIRGREQWRELGGETFIFIPCLNTHPLWIKALAKLIQGK